MSNPKPRLAHHDPAAGSRRKSSTSSRSRSSGDITKRPAPRLIPSISYVHACLCIDLTLVSRCAPCFESSPATLSQLRPALPCPASPTTPTLSSSRQSHQPSAIVSSLRRKSRPWHDPVFSRQIHPFPPRRLREKPTRVSSDGLNLVSEARLRFIAFGALVWIFLESKKALGTGTHDPKLTPSSLLFRALSVSLPCLSNCPM